MSTVKVIVLVLFALDLILIIAYIELNAVKRYYKRQFESKPHAYVYVEKYSWQRRIVDLMLLSGPVAIKQTSKVIKLNNGNELGRKPKMAAHCFNSDAVKTSNQLFIHLFRKKGGSME